MKYLKLFFLLLLSINSSAQKGKVFISAWQPEAEAAVTIPADKYSYFEKQKLYVNISNNNDIIVVSLRIEDPVVQNRILKEGLTLWLSFDGKLNKVAGVRFPIGSLNAQGRRNSNLPANMTDKEGNLITPLSMANTIELIGFTGEEMRIFPSDNADSFRGSIKYDNDGNLNYRLVMPVSKLAIRNAKDGDGAMPFTMGIEYGIVAVIKGPGTMTPPPSVPPSGGSRGGGGRSGGGAPGGRGSAAGGAGFSQSSTQTTLPSVLLWIKNIKLAGG
jgi:hypothetical protein